MTDFTHIASGGMTTGFDGDPWFEQFFYVSTMDSCSLESCYPRYSTDLADSSIAHLGSFPDPTSETSGTYLDAQSFTLRYVPPVELTAVSELVEELRTLPLEVGEPGVIQEIDTYRKSNSIFDSILERLRAMG
jgi:hypothetical protein